MQKPLPPHDKQSAYLEVAYKHPKFIITLVQDDSRYPVALFADYKKCLELAHKHSLPVIRVGAAI